MTSQFSKQEVHWGPWLAGITLPAFWAQAEDSSVRPDPSKLSLFNAAAAAADLAGRLQ